MTHLYGSTASDDTPIPGEDDTRTGIRTLRASVATLHTSVSEMREQRGRTVRVVSAVVGGALTLGLVPLISTLVGIGELREQQRTMATDVARVLVVAEQLGRQGATVDARLDAVTRENASTRESLRTVEAKIWTLRPRRNAAEE